MSLFNPRDDWMDIADEWFITESAVMMRNALIEKCHTEAEGIKLLEALREPRHTTGDISKEHTRMFNYWKDRGVFPTSTDSHKWAKLSTFDTAWCQVVHELLKFNLPYEKIKQVKKQVFDMPVDKESALTLHEYGFLMTLFNKESRTYLGVFPDGTANILTEADILFTQQELPCISMLQVNLNALYMNNTKHEEYFYALPAATALAREERAVMSSMRQSVGDNVKSLEIRLKNAKPQLLSKKEVFSLTKDKVTIEELIAKYPHSHVTIHNSPSGVNVSIVSTEKI